MATKAELAIASLREAANRLEDIPMIMRAGTGVFDLTNITPMTLRSKADRLEQIVSEVKDVMH